MLKEKLKEVVEKRKKIEPDNDVLTEQCCDEEIRLLEENIEESIKYFKEDCEFEQLYWLSEVFEDLIDQTQNEELWKSFEIAYNKYKNDYPKEEVDSIKLDLDFSKRDL